MKMHINLNRCAARMQIQQRGPAALKQLADYQRATPPKVAPIHQPASINWHRVTNAALALLLTLALLAALVLPQLLGLD